MKKAIAAIAVLGLFGCTSPVKKAVESAPKDEAVVEAPAKVEEVKAEEAKPEKAKEEKPAKEEKGEDKKEAE